jgi:hypothetical protein
LELIQTTSSEDRVDQLQSFILSEYCSPYLNRVRMETNYLTFQDLINLIPESEHGIPQEERTAV